VPVTLAGMATVAAATERFEGFSDEAIQFFLELQAEQSRPWFKAHQDDFVRLCRRPLELFISELVERLAVKAYPRITEAEPHFMRIQRDTRFARDKTPYKTFIAASVSTRAAREGEDDHGPPGIYVSFGLDAEFVGTGVWHMSPEVLARYRAALDSRTTGPKIQKQIDALKQQGFGLEAMEILKRVPPPYPQDHPRGELLRHKGLALGVQPDAKVSSTRAYLDWAEAKLTATAPLMHLLDKALQG
jgi:uncharacterized protein (TIGR02453 family)